GEGGVGGGGCVVGGEEFVGGRGQEVAPLFRNCAVGGIERRERIGRDGLLRHGHRFGRKRWGCNLLGRCGCDGRGRGGRERRGRGLPDRRRRGRRGPDFVGILRQQAAHRDGKYQR